MTEYIGLSLSFCVADICQGLICPEQVTKIVSGTKAESEDNWIGIIACYQVIEWCDFPIEAACVAWDLIDAGKIEQPRLKDDGYINFIADGNWLIDGKQGWLRE